MDIEQNVEFSAGCVLVRTRSAGAAEALLIRVRRDTYEVPKGHIEPGESAEDAARRELVEETGFSGPVSVGPEIGQLSYFFERSGDRVQKVVRYFLAKVPEEATATFAARPQRTRELRWVRREEVASVPLVNEELRSIVSSALDRVAGASDRYQTSA